MKKLGKRKRGEKIKKLQKRLLTFFWGEMKPDKKIRNI
jgi:hypothetical protein